MTGRPAQRGHGHQGAERRNNAAQNMPHSPSGVSGVAEWRRPSRFSTALVSARRSLAMAARRATATAGCQRPGLEPENLARQASLAA